MEEKMIPITLDLIKELRIQGKYAEAKNLLDTFHKKGKEAKKQLNKEINAKDNKIKKNFGICSVSNCKNEVSEGYLTCDECRKRKKEWYYKQKEKK